MSFMPGPSHLHAPRLLQGSKPGLLDPTQPERLLRVPGSTLSFASFDPLTAASGPSHARKRYDPEPARAKRIVIETPPGGRGTNRWRFVPRAPRAPGVEDEGVWPRRVLIDGEPYIISEDQWDIYKLDPEYQCFIPHFPGDTIITRKPPNTQTTDGESSHAKAGQARKRGLSTTPEPGAEAEKEPISPGIHKKFRTVVNLVTDEEDTEIESETESDDADEVEEIVAEEFARTSHANLSGHQNGRRKAQESRRKEQRDRFKSNLHSSSFESQRSRTPEIVDLTMEDDSPPLQPSTNTAPPSGPPPGTTKRRFYTERERSLEPDNDEPFRQNKRVRPNDALSFSSADMSTASAGSDFDRKRSQRKRSKLSQRQERQEYANRMREDRERRLWEDILADTPRDTPQGSQSSGSANGESQGDARPESQEPGPMTEEEAQRLAAIEESRRKLAELEKDRPLWEQEARKRAERERAEQEAARRRKEEEQRRANASAAEAERQRQRAAAAAAEAERRARAEAERVAREREQRRRRERERWSYGPWTTTRAIERYKMLSEAFDSAKFTPEDPVMFETIPWPVLHSPVMLRVEDIEWSAVEDFFAAARRHMRPQDYKAFVEKSHKRFHPDRWRARGVLKSVPDEETRGCLEVAANTVAQALTPIWRDVRG
ncbi:hypothetical protein C8Q77DRAFT_1280452 [Trametes polyzona]|nr:hypothetical protein C8Q77DRAFT_1280452 [Trametes polyzona]